MTEPRDFDAERRRIIRRLSLFTWGLWAGAVALALAGGAVLAWMLGAAGLPFLTTWVLAALLLLVVPAALQVLLKKRADDGG